MHGKTIPLLVVTAALAACGDDPAGPWMPVAATVEVLPGARVVAPGDTLILTAYPRTADGDVLGSVHVHWYVDDPAVAALADDYHGVRAVILAPGVARVTARTEGPDGVEGTTRLTVLPTRVPVVALQVTPATVHGDAAMTHGWVTVHRPGRVVITAAAEGLTARAVIEVAPAAADPGG